MKRRVGEFMKPGRCRSASIVVQTLSGMQVSCNSGLLFLRQPCNDAESRNEKRRRLQQSMPGGVFRSWGEPVLMLHS